MLNSVAGTPDQPICISSYGEGVATILPGQAGGILIWNAGGFHLSDLKIVGDGYPRNRADGICLFASGESSARWSSILIENIEVQGFGRSGVAIGSRGSTGFTDVTLRRVIAHENAFAGIYSWSDTGDYAHSGLTVQDCITHSNPGIPGLRQHSGHGILITRTDGAVVERCHAYENGKHNSALICGPAGIWASESRSVVIRQNESYRNHSGSMTDGGGFGLDGGTSDSVLEENRSFENDGPGFLLAQYVGASPHRNNRMIGNWSTRDARQGDHGAIHIWATDGDPLRNCLIAGNRVWQELSPTGRPRVLFIQGETSGLYLHNNHFSAAEGLDLFIEAAAPQHGMRWTANVFASLTPQSGAVVWEGRFFPEVARWLETIPEDVSSGLLTGGALSGGQRSTSLTYPKYQSKQRGGSQGASHHPPST
jgi:hypothetical protein